MEEVTIKLDRYDSMVKELSKLRKENDFLKDNSKKVIIEVTNNDFSFGTKSKEWDIFLQLQKATSKDEKIKRIQYVKLEDVQQILEKEIKENITEDIKSLKSSIKYHEETRDEFKKYLTEEFEKTISDETEKRKDFEIKYLDLKTKIAENDKYYNDRITTLKSKIPWWKTT